MQVDAKKIIVASGETTYEVCFGQGDLDYHSFPDTYAISKLCGERTARGFARIFGVDIYALRIGNVIELHEYERDFPKYANEPTCRKRNAWPYIYTRDLGQIVTCAFRKMISDFKSSMLRMIPSRQRFRRRNFWQRFVQIHQHEKNG